VLGRFVLSFGFAAVAFATSEHALAREQKPVAATPVASAPEAPWYERFTFGSEFRYGSNAWVPRAEQRATVKLTPRSKWGVTFGVQPESQGSFLPRPRQTSAGAVYEVNPKVQVGGRVVIPDARLENGRRANDRRGLEPGVKVESAFRF
jgi:hypothetical protein